MLSVGVVASWMQFHAAMCLGQVPPTASPSHQWQPVVFEPRSGVLNLREKRDVACSRDLGHEGGSIGPSPA